MMKMSLKMVFFITLMLLLIAPGFGLAGDYVKKPTFKKGKITVGHCNALTGPISAEMETITAGVCARIWYQNHFFNGIDGHRVYHMWEDNEYNAQKSVEMYHRFVSSGATGVFSDGAPSATPLKPLTARDKIPLFEGGFEIKVGYPPSYEWLVGADYGKQAFSTIYWWYKNEWPKSADYGKRKPRVAFLYWKGGFGESIIPQAVPSLEKLGFDVVKKTVISYKPVSVQPEILALKKSKPDFVFINITVEVSAMLLKEAYAQGLQQSGVQFGGSIWNSNEIITKISPRGNNGFLLPSPYPWEAVASDELAAIGAKYNKERDPDYNTPWTTTSNFMTGWILSSVYIEGVQRAVDKVGYKNLKGDDVQNELKKLVFDVPLCKIKLGSERGKPYTLDYTGKIMPENIDNRFGNSHVFICQWNDGKFTVIDDLKVPFDKLSHMPKRWMR